MNSRYNRSKSRTENMLANNVNAMENRRNGENGEVPPRRKRIYTDGKNWFFLTRNNGNHGPYQTFTEAKSALKLFMRRSGIINFNDDPSRM